MRHVRATGAKQRLAALLDAAQREPIVIRRQNRDITVALSPAECERIRGLNVAEFQQFCERVGRKAVQRGLTSTKLAQLVADHAPRAPAPRR